MKKTKIENRPSSAEIKNELSLLKEKKRKYKSIGFVIATALSAAAIIVLLTNLVFPMFRVMGNSMEPQLATDDIILCFDANDKIERGDIIAFYHNDTVLLKRVVGVAGDVLEIDEDGVLYINGEVQFEPYVADLSLEPCDIIFPIQVPDNSFFVLGDQRTISMDSRSEAIGMIAKERVIGKALLRIWPIYKIERL